MKKILKRAFLPIMGFAMALVLPSCIESETEITLNKDGSGTITEEVVFGAQMIGMMEMAKAQGAEADDPIGDMKDKAKIAAKAKAYGEGVTFVKSEDVTNKDGGKGVRLTFAFKDINKITFSPNSALGDMGSPSPSGEEKKEDEEHATFKYVDGNLTITLPQPDGAGEDGEEEGDDDFDPNDPQAAMAAQMMKGMKVNAKLTVADGIAKTNATHQDGNSITLFEINMDEILKNPKGMAALNGLQKLGPEGAAEALQKIKGAKVETQKEVTVTVK